MLELRKPRIGLAGVMSIPFRGDKEGNYRSDIQGLEQLAQELDFELYVVNDGVYNLDQAKRAARELEEWQADLVLLQTSSFASGFFLYPFTRIKAKLGLWSVPEGPPSPEGGLPLNSFTASNMFNSILRTTETDYQEPVKWFLGHPGQPYFDHRLDITIQALRAVINLPGARIALIGGVAPSFDNLIIDPTRMEARLGIQTLEFDLEEVLQIARDLQPSVFQATPGEITSGAVSVQDGQEEALEKTARVFHAIQILAERENFQAVALSCWPQFQEDYGLAVCTVMGHLNSSGMIAACEGDLTSAASMLALRCLTNGEVVTLMDLAAVDQEDESILFWHCGPTAPDLADDRGLALKSLWLFDGPDGSTTGLHNDLVLRPGRASVLGFSTDFERLLILDGEINNNKPSYMGSRGWMEGLRLNGEDIDLDDLVQTLMISGYQHHYPFAYGDLSQAGLEFCAWLGIQPIARQAYTHHLR